MQKIEMVDLKSQYVKIKAEVDQAIQDVILSSAFIKGPQVAAFEKELAGYLHAKQVVGCANGTDALQIALMALGLQPGDEVITPSFTFVATAEVIALLGLKPVFVEVCPDTFTLDPEKLEALITPKTKALIPVHLFGQCANMERIMQLAAKHNFYVIEDAAQALGSDFQFSDGRKLKAGTIGHIGCTSFFPSKNLGCYGDGGALFTNDEELASKIRAIANHGSKVRYYHDSIGVNSRLDSMQAAILSVKLKKLDEYNAARMKAAAGYDHRLANCTDVVTPQRTDFSTHIFHQYTLLVDAKKRDSLKDFLATKGIPAMVYYPLPLHQQKAFTNLGCSTANLPVTNQLCKQVLSLPMHTELEDEQLDYICTNLISYFKQ